MRRETRTGPGRRGMAVLWGGMVLSALPGFPSVGAVAPPRQGGQTGQSGYRMTVAPAATGRQLVRVSLPFPKGMLAQGAGVVASDGKGDTVAALRVLTWHPSAPGEPRWIRRALVTFPYTFTRKSPASFALRSSPAAAPARASFPAAVTVDGESVTIAYKNGPTLRARLQAPARTASGTGGALPRLETVEANAYFRWQRFHLTDAQWPRVIETRVDALGGVVVVAHLQRLLPGDGRAPDLGWEIGLGRVSGSLRGGPGNVSPSPAASPPSPPLPAAPSHAFAGGESIRFLFDRDRWWLYHPTAALKRRGRVEVGEDRDSGTLYRYLRCTAEEKVPMQQAAWHRAEFVVAPAKLAPLTVTLESPHEARVEARHWDALYATGEPLPLAGQPELAALLRYHHDAIARSMAHGDDWGNVTGYSDGRQTGGVFGMNRLNHAAPIFEEAYRTGERRLLETALLWCDNTYDQSIWWGPGQTGGTRYNNVRAMNRTPPENDRTYMWRSNSAVNFCTKGYDSFFLAYEQTGDPRMMEALEAQVRYAAEHLHADRGECRNIGDVRDFIRLYEYTGQQSYLDEALRLFRELRTKLSPGDLFSQGGQPIVPDVHFIEDDDAGYRYPFAKPYIIGYALAGLPELARHAPGEPKLREVIRAVADFLAASQDPVGGWRYPHPRSSSVIMSQGMEHAWQIVQADRLLGPQEGHLDAIERVLRQRLLGWRKTGKLFSGLSGWEIATGKVKQSSELYRLYQRPEERDFTRDYTEGSPGFGSSPPEGLVYFPEVLAFYLQHRPASRLLAPANEEEPLGKVLARVTDK